jgi:hypothetical protein
MVTAHSLFIFGGFTGRDDTAACEAGGVALMQGGHPFGGYYSGFGIFGNVISWDTIFNRFIHQDTYVDTIVYTFTDSNGCRQSAVDSFGVTICEAINNLSLSSQIQIHPNPANTTLYVQVTGVLPKTIKLYTISGQLVYTGSFAPEVDVSMLSAGAYFIEVATGEETGRKIFVKM